MSAPVPQAETYHRLRGQFPLFVYESHDLAETQEGLKLSFCFRMGDATFRPTHTIPKPPGGWAMELSSPLVQRIAFCIGMVELISYWKSACPPQVMVKAGPLCGAEIDWWRKLYYLGLGEFFYTNGISANATDFMDLRAEVEAPAMPRSAGAVAGTLIPVGGGKDSAVSMELLSGGRAQNRVLFINALEASLKCADIAGYDTSRQIRTRRSIDAQLLELNARGFLNGHTPFSAMLAFTSLLVAVLYGCERIALSNESSANESTVPGMPVNHQYSKTFEFESDFQQYVRDWLTEDIHYFSLLRPLNELQITGLLCRHPAYLPVFRSCNVGSKRGVWCGKCPKCVFVAAMLSPFLGAEQTRGVFGNHPLDEESAVPLLEQLTGLADTKPFECVGTVDEVRAALSLARERAVAVREVLPLSTAALLKAHPALFPYPDAAKSLLCAWHEPNAVPPDLLPLLREALKHIAA